MYRLSAWFQKTPIMRYSTLGMEDLTLMLVNRETIDVVYLDYKKAFDCVPQERLLSKLGACEVIGSI